MKRFSKLFRLTTLTLTASMILTASMMLPIIGCEGYGQNSPKQVVIGLFGAMEKDDKAALAHLLDLAALMQNIDTDYALSGDDKPRVFSSPQQILEDLTENGLTKTRWFSMQRIINDVEILGETATVEVTFVDKKASKGYTTKFGLHTKNGKWKIYSFNVTT